MKHEHKGQAMVEMALLLPLLVLLAIGMVDLGRAFYYKEAITNVAREGARYGASYPRALPSEIEAKALQENDGLITGITVVPDDGNMSDDTVSVTASYKFTLITPLMKGFFGGSDTVTLTSTSRMPVLGM